MSHLANAILALATTVANMVGSELQIIISDTGLETRFVRPGPRDEWYWEPSYQNGAVFYEGYATPIKVPEPPENEVITTDEYATYMKQDVIKQAFATEGTGDTPWLLIGIMATFAVAGLSLLLLLGGGV